MKKIFLFLLATSPVFAEDLPPPPSGGLTQTITLFAIAMIFFYFILYRPEQKRRKAADALRSSLKKGDRVNALGIIGTVAKVNEQTVVLRMVEGAKIEVVKAAITEVTPGTEEDAKIE